MIKLCIRLRIFNKKDYVCVSQPRREAGILH